ncbi:ATP-dependent helicase HrpB [Nitratidesulfovibrio liaohensis]|uniref:ATP-dependent helicase HrpB n=1 Tax=Nitratidesulfovibrio liaohensis TaxID=2604158 RepID=A0ABY9R1X6_9BACT|nr:ATP-dependent helicase HrpB [Nitratidesulfovibrio liaohensis]WMW65724.1 ATP-dependent helicase HrpB [Nitratidesulfovibrio liaohensis]
MTASFPPDARIHSPVASAIHPLVHLLATGAALPGAPGVPRLPVDAELPHLLGVLADGVRAVLQAPPGAGKTTRVPLALLAAPWLDGRKVVLLEPRRLAARAAARRMAATLGEAVGDTVGYRMRLDTRVGPHTRVEVVTEGVLTRMLQTDPELADVGCVIFDEFHERSLHADLGLALCLDCQEGLRPDLRLVVMSATLDCGPVANLLDGCPVIESAGRAFPVDTRHLPPVRNWLPYDTTPPGVLEDAVADAVRRALHEGPGSLLVFLPGAGEIRRTAERLAGLADTPHGPVTVHALYGDLPPELQDAAIAPAPPGTRKVVLATAIAETSLTIDGVRVVIDTGLAREPRFDPRSGMSRLVTERVSLAGADQRRGRAGRTGPGTCWRLWREGEEAVLRPFARPEILDADLAPLLLELALWGVPDASALRWLDGPPQANLAQARELLTLLGALDAAGRITPHGRRVAALPLHPRLAHMVVRAGELGLGATACCVAALLEERDPLRDAGADMRLRVALLAGDGRGAGNGTHGPMLTRLREAARQVARLAGVDLDAAGSRGKRTRQGTRPDPEATGEVLAPAYPDRVAEGRGQGQFRLACGRGAYLPPEDPLSRESFLAVGDMDGDAARGRIRRCAPVSRAHIEEAFGASIVEGAFVVWDDRAEAVAARRQRRLGALVLDDAPHDAADPEAVTAAVVTGIRYIGLHCLPWTPELEQWRARVTLLRGLEERETGRTAEDALPATTCPDASACPGEPIWPDVSDAALLAGLEHWLAPYLSGITRRTQFARIDLAGALAALLPWELARRLDAEAPERIEVPSGSQVLVDYAAEGGPVLAVKLQEMFGARETPRVAAGRVPLVVHLLSPAGRPLQVTRDLAGFWRTGYPAVRAEMRGRYPKHPRPEDPPAAPPTRLTTRRMQQAATAGAAPGNGVGNTSGKGGAIGGGKGGGRTR